MKPFVLAAIVFVAACSLPSVGLWSGAGKADTGLYRLYGEKLVDGHLPYRSGFSLEFPPGAIPAFAVPALPGSHYVVWFHLFQLACGVLAIGAVAYARAGYLPPLVVAFSPACLGPITLNAFDLWPAALSAWAVAFTFRGRPRLGAALLGVATGAKLYPVLLAPALLAYPVRREALRAAFVGLAAVGAVFLPFLALAPGGLRFSLEEQARRGLQVESLGGAAFGVAHRLGAGARMVVSQAPFSFDVAGRGASVTATVSSVLVLAAVGFAWWLLRRGPVDATRTAWAVAAAAVGFVAFAKVLSPQYLLFLVPLVALVRSTVAWGAALAALALTQVWARFPEPFLRTVHFGPLIWVTFARNLLLALLYGFLVTRLARSRATSTP
jgi:glycosyl transferase family 87